MRPRTGLLLYVLAGSATALFVSRWLSASKRHTFEEKTTAVENDIDSVGEDSFPASDPPSWSGSHAG